MVIDLRTDVSLLEDTLEQPFAQFPRVREKSYRNRVRDFMGENGMSVGSLLLELLRWTVAQNSVGKYCSFTETIYVRRGHLSKKIQDYVRLHELAHCYDHQRRMEISPDEKERNEKRRKEIQELGLWNLFQKRTVEREEIEESIVRMCVEEGIAEYVAIEAERKVPHPGKYSDVRRKLLVFNRHSEVAANVARMGNQMINACHRAADGKNVLSSHLAESNMKYDLYSMTPYVVGYNYVNAVRNLHPDKTIGEVIDVIILNHPKTMQDIEDTINHANRDIPGYMPTLVERCIEQTV